MFKEEIKRGLKIRNNDLSIDSIIDQIIICLLLGDGRIDKQKINYNARLCFEQSHIHKDYLLHLFEIFQKFCGVSQPSYREKLHKKTLNINKSYYFKTLSSNCFNIYHSIFYPNQIKIVPFNIENLLTPIGLAYWAMDDGYKIKNNFGFSTEGYTKEDVELLRKVMLNKFSLDSSLHNANNGRYRLYIKTNSMRKFKELVEPHFHPSMVYKIK